MKACCQLAETLVSFLLLQQLSEDFIIICPIGWFCNMFTEIRELFGSKVLRTVRSYVSTGTCIVRHRSHLRFDHRCLSSEILPRSLRTKPLINTKEGRKLAKKFGMQNLRLRIHMSHERIRLCNKKLNSLSYQLQAELDEGFFLKVQQQLSVTQTASKKRLDKHHNDIFEKLLITHRQNKLFSIQNCSNKEKRLVVNLSSVQLTEAQISVLQLDLNFVITPKAY